MKLLLIGGHPKGHNIPFHKKTRSGKILRTILEKNKINPKIINLWKDESEEKKRALSKETINQINQHKKTHHIIALGRYQEKALIKNNIKCIYLPHPASWQPNDREKLTKGLIRLNKNL